MNSNGVNFKHRRTIHKLGLKFILIHGPEASGKLTVAKSLQQLTGFNLFHNHVSIDVGNVLFRYGEPAFDELVFAVRLLVFEAAAKENLPGLIFTWAYTDPQCRGMHNKIVETLSQYDAEISYVYLNCEQREREARVIQSDRTQARKIDTIEQLRTALKRKNCVPIPNVNSLTIENTSLSAEETAKKIFQHYQLASSTSGIN